MAYRVLLDACSPALDVNALPQSGATLTFREAGTTDLQDVFTTLACDTEHDNPLTADSAGRFPQLWAPNGYIYDIIWKDGNGATVKTLYNVGAGDGEGGGGGGGGGSGAYEHWFYDPQPVISTNSSKQRFAQSVTFPEDLEGSEGAVDVYPDAITTFSIQVNTIEKGTIVIPATSGAITFTAPDAFVVAANDLLEIVAPADLNGLEGLTATLLGALA